MVLRCSLLGHAYGEPEVQREREERGSEVVVTVQEFEECARCGERNVISENTEVKSLVTDSDDRSRPDDSEPESTTQRPDPDAEVAATADEEPDVAETAATPDESDTDAVIVDAEPTEEEPADADPVSASSDDGGAESDDLDVPTDESGEPITDDGEILDGETDGRPADDRERGEWPESDDVGPPVEADDSSSWPDREGDDSPSATDGEDDAIEDDAIVLEHDESTVGTSSGAEAIATESEILDAAAGVETDPDTDSGSGIERAEPAPKPGEMPDRRSEDVPTEFYCPRCDYVDTDDRGSLRAGDICPECRKGYLGERPL
ncbi:hypothetical protein AB7C87_06905 [Natrarchaeobius sp. A-rgal3]|uniref:DUF7093 family protein n=1 Tax=Natrarchaeobius versutus TaxID=1679078 RepID=UPI00350F43B3